MEVLCLAIAAASVQILRRRGLGEWLTGMVMCRRRRGGGVRARAGAPPSGPRRAVATPLGGACSGSFRSSDEDFGRVMAAEQGAWGWASSVETFLSTPPSVVTEALDDHHVRLFGFRAAGTQTGAWVVEEAAVRDALRACILTDVTIAARWSIVFEYELPLEGGRRPDVVVLAGGAVAVLEFKSAALPAQADIDQVRAYARDLADYHEASHGRIVSPILVMAGAGPGFARELDGTAITSPEQLHAYLLAVGDEAQSDLLGWLDAPYRPLPTLVEAARRLFRDD